MAWGRVTVFDEVGTPLTDSAIGNRYTFQGREHSWATGFTYFRARWYDPVSGRWLSKDPIGIEGGANQYMFVGNNPVNFLDPLGFWGVWFGDLKLGNDKPLLVFNRDSLDDLEKGSFATIDGLIPFADPFEGAYADSCGEIDASFRASRLLAKAGRGLLLSAAGGALFQKAIAGLGLGSQYAALPLYEKALLRSGLISYGIGTVSPTASTAYSIATGVGISCFCIRYGLGSARYGSSVSR